MPPLNQLATVPTAENQNIEKVVKFQVLLSNGMGRRSSFSSAASLPFEPSTTNLGILSRIGIVLAKNRFEVIKKLQLGEVSERTNWQIHYCESFSHAGVPYYSLLSFQTLGADSASCRHSDIEDKFPVSRMARSAL